MMVNMGMSYEELLESICEGNSIPLGFTMVKDGIVLAEEDGNVELFVKFAEDKILISKIPA